MATVEQHLPETHNGVAETGEGIAVENPATGETIAIVCLPFSDRSLERKTTPPARPAGRARER
jgi:hypothetical protein